MSPPERHLLVQHLGLQPLPLPHRIVGILNGQRRQGVGLTLTEGAIERCHFPHQYTDGPAIRDDVMLRDQQQMFL